MGVVASMQPGEPVVQPGETTSRVVKIRNTGQVVDNVLVDVVGDAAAWTKVEPPSLNLFPGDEGQVTVTFAPPRSAAVRAGVVPFAVRVVSREDTAGSVVEEGEIEVAAFTELAAEVVPRTIRAKRQGKAEVAVDNVGNMPVDVQLVVEDPEGKLRGTVSPAMLTLEPGKATFADVVIRPRKTFWKGASQTLPYQVAVVPEGGQAPLFADGVVLQEQILPKWLWRLLLALLAAALVLWILWQTLFKSVVESAAREAVAEEVAAVEEVADDAAAAAEDASAAAEEASAAAEEASQTAEEATNALDADGDGTIEPEDVDGLTTGGGGGGTSLEDLLASGDQADFRVRSNAVPNNTFQNFDAAGQPADQIVFVTDIVFQNPAADLGVVQVLRGSDVLLEVGLPNFRDLDYHFLAPLRFDPGEQLRIAVRCDNAAPGNTGNCTASVLFSTIVVDQPPETTTTTAP